jgi:gamma-glutamyltranspeptidase/glutathione hydrolase
MRNPALAETLRRLARHGLEDFYRGGIAAQIADDMKANGGFIRKADLEGFPDPNELPPRRGHFCGKEVVSIGPPGGGLTLLHMLNLYDKVEVENRRFEKPEDYVLLANIIRLARRDRKTFQKETPMRSEGRAYDFLTDDYAERALSGINQPDPSTEGDTSHISVMDRWGNAVAMTQSLDRVFGAKVIHPELGFLYNSYLKAFKIKAKSHSHFLRPGSLARSNAAPTLVFRDGAPCAVLGSTGSERIVSGLLQVLLRLEHQSPFESIHAPRLHCTPNSEVLLEIERLPSAVPPALVSSGFRLRPVEAYSYLMGGVQLVQRKDGEFLGVSDPRRDSAAGGPEKGGAGFGA